MAVNCAALSETLIDERALRPRAGRLRGGGPAAASARIEEARGGTLYLHEVGRLSPAVQVRLLRVLQEGRLRAAAAAASLLAADVRVVAGSSRDLAEEVRHGRFRDDLYYRLNVVAAALPPLRDRKADIPALVAHLLADRARAAGTPPLTAAPGVLSAFFAYPWPGNLRELEAVVEEAAARATGAELRVEDLPPVLAGGQPEEGQRPAASSPAPRSSRSSARPSCGRWSRRTAPPPAPPRCSASRSGRSSTGSRSTGPASPGAAHPAAAVAFGGEPHAR